MTDKTVIRCEIVIKCVGAFNRGRGMCACYYIIGDT